MLSWNSHVAIFHVELLHIIINISLDFTRSILLNFIINYKSHNIYHKTYMLKKKKKNPPRTKISKIEFQLFTDVSNHQSVRRLRGRFLD